MIPRLRRLVLAVSTLASAAFLFVIGWIGVLQLNILRAGLVWTVAALFVALALVLIREALNSADEKSESTASPPGLRSVRYRPDCGRGDAAAESRSEPAGSALVIEREKQWVNRLRRIEVVLDGLQVAAVAGAQAAQLDVDPGRHRIYVRIDSSRSREQAVDLRTGETVRFRCGSLIAGWRILIGPYIYLARHSLYLARIPDPLPED